MMQLHGSYTLVQMQVELPHFQLCAALGML
jgi:hypothetical protein